MALNGMQNQPQKQSVSEQKRLKGKTSGEPSARPQVPLRRRQQVASPPGVEVKIAGTSLRLKSSHSTEKVMELARVVSEKIDAALPLTKSGSIQMATLLACLNMADEIQQLRAAFAAELEDLERQARSIHSQLESCPLPKSWSEIAPS